VRVETDRVVEVAERDVPLAAQRRSVALDRKIGVAGLVRERRGRDERDDEQQNIADHLRTIATEATATFSIRVDVIHCAAISSAAASPAARAASTRMRRSAGSRWTFQFARASASAAGAAFSMSRRKRASS